MHCIVYEPSTEQIVRQIAELLKRAAPHPAPMQLPSSKSSAQQQHALVPRVETQEVPRVMETREAPRVENSEVPRVHNNIIQEHNNPNTRDKNLFVRGQNQAKEQP